MKHIPYFENLPDSSRATVERARNEQLRIRVNDLLAVDIKQPLGSGVESTSGDGGSGTGSSAASDANSGYIVDPDGYIDLPLIGKIFVQGLTIKEAKKVIGEKVSYYYKSAMVSVRFMNLKVSVLGEVNNPGVFTFPTEGNTIFDALAKAGDLTIYGKRTNLVLIRDSSGFTNFIRFGLNNTNIVSQQYYYLRPNDIIYVEPSRAKVESLNAVVYAKIGIAATILSFLTLIYTQIINK